MKQGVHAVAVTGITATRGFPQILMVEAVAQLAGIAVAQTEVEGGFIATIDHAEFSAPAVTGDILTISARVTKSFGRLFMIDGNVASAAGQLLSVQLTLGVGKL